MSVIVQGTAIAIDGRGILLTGPPGCGKSDLALRLVGRGAQLIGDDLVRVAIAGERICVSALRKPSRLHVAHVGVIAVGTLAIAPLALVVALESRIDRDARLDSVELLPGWSVPRITLPGLEASAPDKLLLALERWGH
jgi:serine kinase of HPr protein (carbohydrate metabolism regulator)